MQLSTSDLQFLAGEAIEAAREAGQYIARQLSIHLPVFSKSGGESIASQIFTEADLNSQQLILDRLTPTLLKYDLGLLTEESADDASRHSKDYFWCIDPLDGTLAFTRGEEGFSVAIALVSHSGEPIIGVVYNPWNQTLYHAIRQQGVYLNEQAMTLPDSPGTTLLLFTDRSFTERTEYPILMQALQSLLPEAGYRTVEVHAQAGAVINACRVLQHPDACYFKFPKATQGGGSLWDYAATACLFAEANACATNFEGKPLDLNRTNSCFMNHQGILYASSSRIAALLRQIPKRMESLKE